MKNTKKAAETQSVKVATENKKVDSNTLDVLAAKLQKSANEKLAEKEQKKEKNFLYRFQIESPNLSTKEQKSKRKKLRDKIKDLAFQLHVKKDKNEAANEFLSFYKENFIKNDFTLKSCTNSQVEKEIEFVRFALEFCKQMKSK